MHFSVKTKKKKKIVLHKYLSDSANNLLQNKKMKERKYYRIESNEVRKQKIYWPVLMARGCSVYLSLMHSKDHVKLFSKPKKTYSNNISNVNAFLHRTLFWCCFYHIFLFFFVLLATILFSSMLPPFHFSTPMVICNPGN